ncbi:MAG: NAD(P)/FAD-dependent oxidoreductase [Spirochaetaceae bacterium]|nr:NAD(P)/FAD-dependent oxidoreductase [Myxococcales bacterium]MCB9726003.1 NAD(P)/FAD-dependent oxidoreductase [Spirochaetaceae bacterium]
MGGAERARSRARRDPRIVIVGAGPGGLAMGIKLMQAGLTNFVILEKSDRIGGTWNHNRYPGCACDIPSHLYSFSFEIKRDWSRPYAPQPEILDYLDGVAEKYGVLPFCRFGDGVRRAVWDEASARWTLELESGRSVEAEIVVSAIGMFNDLVFPAIPGLDEFAGTCIHTARWSWEHSLAGERVAVIGSAASAVQLVPEVAKEAARVHLFQRSANWVLPKEDDPYTEAQLEHFRNDPDAARAVRQEIFDGIEAGKAFVDRSIGEELEAAALGNMAVVEDPEVRAKLVPTHKWGCKRPLFSNDYYPAFNRPNLELVTEPIERITRDAVVTADGRARTVDTLVLATGFEATRYLSAIDVVGRGGVSIHEAWKDGAQAHFGVTTAGFPNLFMLYGPNTNQGSLITMIEWEADHALRLIRHLVDEDLAWVDTRPEPMALFNERLQKEIATIEPWQDGCSNYYRSPSGRVVTQWPHSMGAFRDALAAIPLEDYEFVGRG